MKTTRHSNPEPQNRASQRPNIPPNIREAIERILDYLWADEAADYLETSQAEGRPAHIFLDLRKLRTWLRS